MVRIATVNVVKTVVTVGFAPHANFDTLAGGYKCRFKSFVLNVKAVKIMLW